MYSCSSGGLFRFVVDAFVRGIKVGDSAVDDDLRFFDVNLEEDVSPFCGEFAAAAAAAAAVDDDDVIFCPAIRNLFNLRHKMQPSSLPISNPCNERHVR